MTDRTDRPLTVQLTHPSAVELTVTGGKGANLARLVEAGLPVPSGFCVTTAAYDAHEDDSELAVLVDDLETINPTDTTELHRIAGDLREKIRSTPLSADVRSEIEASIDREVSYGVRSSATAEDRPTASFAGQHDTFLDVTGPDAVVDAVKRCFASLFTDRAVSYRANNDIPHGGVSMAVVVQRMIDADASGVLFTADPSTGNRSIAAIDAATGLGEAVVSGTVTADNIKVDRETGEIRRYRIGNDEASAPTDTNDDRKLTDDQVTTLVSYGEVIERLFGSPQDVEWSIANGRLWILQSRPITTLFPIPTPSPIDVGTHVYYSWNHRQGMTEAMPPLVVDYWLRTMDVMFDGLGYDPETGPVGVHAGGRIYLDVTPLVRSKRLAPRIIEGLEEFDRDGTEQLETVHECQRDELAEMSLFGGTSLTKTLSTVGSLLPVFARSLGGIVGGLVRRDYDRAPDRGRQWADRTAQRLIRNIRSERSIETRIQRSLEANAEFTWIALERALLLWNVYFYRWTLEGLCPGSGAEFETLERGLRGNVTTSMMLELGDVTDLARDHPAVEQAILDGQGLDELRDVEGGESFVNAFEEFLDRYGFRAPAEIEFSRPRYREDPSSLLGTIRSSIRTGERGNHWGRIEELEDEVDRAIARLERSAERTRFGSLRRRLVRPLAVRYRSFLSLREVTKYGLSQLLDETRRQVIEAGVLLENEGGLENAEDVWLYEFDELLAAIERPGAASTVDIESRRSDYQNHRTIRAPRVITSTGEVPRGAELTDSDVDGLVGTPTSGGVAEGIARVVREPGEASIESGDILVAPHTDPGWTPLFLNAGGLVTDVGGEMTHGSLVAREYGIPSVVLAEATETLETGERIRVDGTRGTVERLDED